MKPNGFRIRSVIGFAAVALAWPAHAQPRAVDAGSKSPPPVATQPPTTQPPPTTEPALSFNEAYGRILERNLDVQTQQVNVQEFRARELGRVGAFTPTLKAQASELQQNDQDSYPFQGKQSAQLALNANLFRSGTDFAALKAANRDVDASEESLRDQKLKAEDDAATALITFIRVTRTRELIEQIVGIKQESLKIAKERYAKGLLAQQEVDKVQIDLDNSRARLIDADTNLAQARAAVSQRMGAYQSINLDWPWKSAIVVGPRPEAIEFKLENRPDYKAALQTLEAEDWRRHASRSLLLPSLDLSAGYGSFDLSQAGRRDWSALLTLTIPLFDGFQGWSAARLQNLVKQQAEIAREQVTRNAGAEIETYRVAFTEARESATAREKTAEITQKLFTDNLQRFRLGRASADELSIDQSRLLEAEILEVDGWANAHLSFEHLCHSLGRSMSADGVCR